MFLGKGKGNPFTYKYTKLLIFGESFLEGFGGDVLGEAWGNTMLVFSI